MLTLTKFALTRVTTMQIYEFIIEAFHMFIDMLENIPKLCKSLFGHFNLSPWVLPFVAYSLLMVYVCAELLNKSQDLKATPKEIEDKEKKTTSVFSNIRIFFIEHFNSIDFKFLPLSHTISKGFLLLIQTAVSVLKITWSVPTNLILLLSNLIVAPVIYICGHRLIKPNTQIKPLTLEPFKKASLMKKLTTAIETTIGCILSLYTIESFLNFLQTLCTLVGFTLPSVLQPLIIFPFIFTALESAAKTLSMEKKDKGEKKAKKNTPLIDLSANLLTLPRTAIRAFLGSYAVFAKVNDLLPGATIVSAGLSACTLAGVVAEHPESTEKVSVALGKEFKEPDPQPRAL